MNRYYVRANKKVGKQDIGPLYAFAYATDEKPLLITKMKLLFPHARVSAHRIKDEAAHRAALKTIYGDQDRREVNLDPPATEGGKA